MAAVSALLEGGATVDAVNMAGGTALHVASHAGHAEVIRALVEAAASVDAVNMAGGAALHLASHD